MCGELERGEVMPKLTEKQRRFVEEYLIDLNATQAAIRAGYPAKSASEQGYQLLRKTSVSEAINRAMAKRSRRTGISQDRVLEELAVIAFSNGSDFARVVNKPELDKFGQIIIDPSTGEVRTYTDVELIPTDELSPEKQRAIANIKQSKYGIEVTTCDKIKALELIGKHLGMFKEKLEISKPIDDSVREMEDYLCSKKSEDT